MKNTFSKGFTLMEMLVVITILAVLAAAVVLILNPAELLAQGRDAQRISDLSAVQDAIIILVAQGLVPAPSLCLDGTAAGGGCNDGGICMIDPGIGNGPFSVQTCGGINAVRTVAGAGWVDVDLTDVRVGGSPIVILPIDPINNTLHFYAYKATTGALGTFELAGRLESSRYRSMMENDGGTRNACVGAAWNTSTCFYELGSNLAL